MIDAVFATPVYKSDNLYNLKEEQIQYFSKLPPSIRRALLVGSPPKFKGLSKEAKLFVKMANVPLPWDTSNVEFLKAAEEAGVFLGKTQGGSAKNEVKQLYL